MSDSIAKFKSLYTPVLIENHDERGVIWAIGIGSPNPYSDRYFEFQSKEDAHKCHAMILKILEQLQ